MRHNIFTLLEQDEFFLLDAKRKGYTFDVEKGLIFKANGEQLGHKTKRGIHMISTYYSGKTYGINRARAIWLYAKGMIKADYGVSHIRECSNDAINNLELTTVSDRSKKAIRDYGWKLGNKTRHSKITLEMVNEDRRFERENPGSHDLLAKKRGISRTSMIHALRGISWPAATEPPVTITRLPRPCTGRKSRVYKTRPKVIREPKPKVEKTPKPKRERVLAKPKPEKVAKPKPEKVFVEPKLRELKPVKVSIPKPVPYQELRRVAKSFLLNNPHISNKGILRFLQMRAIDERISLPKLCAITTQIKQEIQQRTSG